MNRRQYLSAVSLPALAGCLGNTSSSDPLSDQLPEDGVYNLDEWAEYEVILIKASGIKVRDSVEYKNTEEATIKTWDPGEERSIIVVSFWVENLSNDSLEYPSWEEFELVTPEKSHTPVLETPDGSSVDQIRDPHVSWVESEGLSADYSRGWSGVYVASTSPTENLAVRWTLPDDPIYWRES